MIEKLMQLVDKKLLRFIIVGCINTIVGTAIMFGLYNLASCSYWISSAANYILTSILSFFLNKYFTFRNKERSWKQVMRFAVNIAVLYTGLRYCKTGGDVRDGGRRTEDTRECSHVGRNVSFHWIQLSGTAFVYL